MIFKVADGGVMVVLATLSSGHSRCTSFSSLTTDRNLKCLCTLRSSPPLLQCRAFVSLSSTREIPFGPEPNPCRDGVYVPVQKYAQRFEHVCFKVSFCFWVTTADDCPPETHNHVSAPGPGESALPEPKAHPRPSWNSRTSVCRRL